MQNSESGQTNENKIKKTCESITLFLCFNCRKCIPEIIPIISSIEGTIRISCPSCENINFSLNSFNEIKNRFDKKLSSMNINTKNNYQCCVSSDHKTDLLFCLQCNAWFCSVCRVKHDSLLNNDNQDGFLGNRAKNHISHFFIGAEAQINNCCTMHNYKTNITHYCVECAQCICLFCYEISHSMHNVILINEFIQQKLTEVRRQIGSGLKEINQKIEELKYKNSKDTSPIKVDIDFNHLEEVNNVALSMIKIIVRDCETLMTYNIYDLNLIKNLKKFTTFFEQKKIEANSLLSKNQYKIISDYFLIKEKNEESKWIYEQYKLDLPIYSICKFKNYLLISQGKRFQFRNYFNILEVKNKTETKKETHTLCVVKTENGRFLVVAGEENKIKIYIINIDYSTTLIESSLQKAPIKFIKPLEDKGNIIVTASENFKVKLWKLSESNSSQSSVMYKYSVDKPSKQNKLYSMEKIMDNVLIFGGHSYIYLKNENSFVGLDYKKKIHSDIITCFLAFNSTIFLSGSKDKTINISEYKSPIKQKTIGVFTEHLSPIVRMYKYEDNQVISCSEDGIILVWNIFNLETTNKINSKLNNITFFLYFNKDFVIVNKDKLKLYRYVS